MDDPVERVVVVGDEVERGMRRRREQDDVGLCDAVGVGLGDAEVTLSLV